MSRLVAAVAKVGDATDAALAALRATPRRTRAALAVRRYRWAGILAATVALVLYLLAIGDIAPGGRSGRSAGASWVVVAPDWTERLFRARAPYLFEPVLAVHPLPHVTVLLSPVNLVLGGLLAVLVGLNVTVAAYAAVQATSCRRTGYGRLLAALPALLTGIACCVSALDDEVQCRPAARLDTRRFVADQPQPVRPAHCLHTPRDTPQRGRGQPVLQPRNELHAQLHPAGEPFDQPHQHMRRVLADPVAAYAGCQGECVELTAPCAVRNTVRSTIVAAITRTERDGTGYRVTLTGADGRPAERRAEQVLVATGRRPVTAGLNLDAVGVKTGTRGEVVVNEHLRTDNHRIWAAGDVTGHPQFVYVAAAHGTLVADNAFDDAGRTPDYHHLPPVTFTSPAIASAGLTDAQAVEQGHTCECRVLPLEYVPRALVNRDTQGLIKLVADRGTGRLLGAHVVAADGRLQRRSGINRLMFENRMFLAGSFGADFHPDIQPQSGDIILTPHKGTDVLQTDLREHLDRLGTTRLVIAGMTANLCVESTGRHATELGYDVTFLSDAIGAESLPAYEASIHVNFPLIANAVLEVDEFLDSVAPTAAQGQDVRPGDAVYGSDRGQIGKVEEVVAATEGAPGHLVVQRGAIFDKQLFVPLDAVTHRTGTSVFVNIPKLVVSKLPWDERPTAESAAAKLGSPSTEVDALYRTHAPTGF